MKSRLSSPIRGELKFQAELDFPQEPFRLTPEDQDTGEKKVCQNCGALEVSEVQTELF
jgi:hypothetical protein